MADGALRRWWRAIPWKVVRRGALLGALAGLGHPPFGLWGVTVLAFGAVFYQLLRVDGGKLALALGLGFGSGYFALSLSWIVEPFFVEPWRHGWMAPFAITFMAVGLSLFWGAAFWLAKRVSVTGVSVVATLALAELARAYVLTGFPWAMPSYVLVDQAVGQGAAYVSSHGMNVVLFGGSWMLAWAVFSGANRRRNSIAALLGVVAFTFPVSAPTQVAKEAGPVVRLVQPNAPQHQKWDPQYAKVFFERLIRYSALGDTRPDLIVWPETAVPVWLNNAANTLSVISGAARGVPVVLGINRAEGARIYNAAVVLDAQGQVTQTYDKHHLVPFGEYIPLGNVLNQIGISGFASRNGDGFSRGAGAQILDLGALGKALPLICYEAVFPQDVRAAPERPEFILHMTNDAWFGNFSGPYQHLVQAQMRAIEFGLPVLRAANTGVSAVIDANGRVLDHLALNTEGFLDAPLPRAAATTFYAKTGDMPLALVLAALLLLTILVRRRESD